MPNLSLLVMSSPLILGGAAESLPQTQNASRSAVAPTTYSAAPATIMLPALSWSLTSAQEPQESAEDTPEESAQSSDQDLAPEGQEENMIVVEGSYGPPESDPMERINVETYRIVTQVDDALVEPIAFAYRDGLPTVMRDGVRNVIHNLREPVNALNFLLQLKVGKAIETVGRFAINSTLGLGGLIDIAEKPGIGLPYRRNGFANTMGFYGVGPGPYAYLPLTGPTTARDFVGGLVDAAVLPTFVGKPFSEPAYVIPVFVLDSLDERIVLDAKLTEIESSDDPYAARRDGYLRERAAAIQAFKEGSPEQGIIGVEALEELDASQQQPEAQQSAPGDLENTPPQEPQAQHSQGPVSVSVYFDKSNIALTKRLMADDQRR